MLPPMGHIDAQELSRILTTFTIETSNSLISIDRSHFDRLCRLLLSYPIAKLSGIIPILILSYKRRSSENPLCQ